MSRLNCLGHFKPKAHTDKDDMIEALNAMKDMIENERFDLVEYNYWAEQIEDAYDYLLERIKRVEEIRFQNG